MTSFSIVTIVYNDATHIKETMDSVINQSYKNLEYILIDGGSNDGTKEAIIEQILSCATVTHQKESNTSLYLEAIHNTHPTLTFKFLSEKDRGIYDAMNKGIALSSKEWINLMNCGDRFYNLEVLDNVKGEDIKQCDVIYGDTEIIENSRSFLSISVNEIKNRMPFCHQSSFVKTHILTQYYFDTSYKICADNDLFMKLYRSKHIFKKLTLPISTYSLDGLSSSLTWQLFYEDCKIGFKYNKLFPLYLAIKWILWTIPKKQIKKLLSR